MGFGNDKTLFMKSDLTLNQKEQYKRDGFLIIEFLLPEELGFWRQALDEAVEKEQEEKCRTREVYGTGDDADKSYYDNVFALIDQSVERQR